MLKMDNIFKNWHTVEICMYYNFAVTYLPESLCLLTVLTGDAL